MNAETIFQGMEVYVQLDGGKRIQLREKNDGNENKASVMHFHHEEKKINLSLERKEKKNKTYLFLKGGIQNEDPLVKSECFASEHAVIIKIKDRKNINGLMAHYRFNEWWTRPYFEKTFVHLPERTQSLLWRENGSYLYMIPTVGKEYRTDMSGNETGLELRISSFAGGYDKVDTLVGVLGIGEEPYALCKETIEETMDMLGNKTIPREKKTYPLPFEYLGWCSWDAFYTKVNEEGIKEKIDELTSLGVPVKWVMVDDGWLDVKGKTLVSFEPNKEKFPEGFRSLTTYLKEEKEVKWVGVWHALMGYWGGIDPESELAKEIAANLHENNQGRLMPSPYGNKAFGFWNRWYAYLKSEGIDLVKVDGQSAVNLFTREQQSIGQAAKEMHTSLEAAVGIHFNQQIINCMGMAPESIWSRPISAISRNSDDFVPGEEISFKEHALQNAYNSFYHGHFYYGDWDMFWSDHEEGLQNSVLRAVSGGPIYISDRIGKTDPKTILPLVLKDGKILRAEQPGMPTSDCLFVNPNNDDIPLKIWNKAGNAAVVASFNIHTKNVAVTGSISPSHVPCLSNDETYLVYDYFERSIEKIGFSEEKEMKLPENGVKMHSFFTYQPNFTPIGLVDKYLSTCAVMDSFQMNNTHVVKLKQGGIFGFYSEHPVKEVKNGEKLCRVEEKENHLYLIDCSDCVHETTLEIVLDRK